MKEKDYNMAEEEKYQNLADCIRSDQLSARQVVQESENKKFKEWYKKKYERIII